MVEFYGCLISNHVLKQRYLTLSYTLCGGGNRLCIYYDLIPLHIQNTHTKHGQNRHKRGPRVKLEIIKKSCDLHPHAQKIPVDFPQSHTPLQKHSARIFLLISMKPGDVEVNFSHLFFTIKVNPTQNLSSIKSQQHRETDL